MKKLIFFFTFFLSFGLQSQSLYYFNENAGVQNIGVFSAESIMQARASFRVPYEERKYTFEEVVEGPFFSFDVQTTAFKCALYKIDIEGARTPLMAFDQVTMAYYYNYSYGEIWDGERSIPEYQVICFSRKGEYYIQLIHAGVTQFITGNQFLQIIFPKELWMQQTPLTALR